MPGIAVWQRRALVPSILAGVAVLVSQVPIWSSFGARVIRPYHAVCELIGIPVDSFTSVPPPVSMDRRPLFAPEAVNVDVTYGSGFAAFPQAQAAFQYAVNIWKTQLTSAVTVKVNADFSALGSGVLGSAGYTSLLRDFTNAPFTATWFPIPIADSLTATDNNAASFDISANFSSSFSNWYFGTDRLTPSGQYDFVSVVLHELGHGMGFAGSMGYSGGIGSWGGTQGGVTYPYVFDRFVVNGSGQSLINTALFPNDSAALGTQLTGDNLFWSGAKAASLNSGLQPRLFAPTTWDDGSSIAHLNDATYSAGNVNSLMTHAINTAEAIHDPGPITRGMLQDSGWALACSYALSPATATIGQAGGTGSVTVIPTPSTCSWTATSNSSFISITSGASGTGTGTVAYSAAANGSGTRTGTLTIGGLTFTLTQGPTMSIDRATLSFGAVNTAGTLSNVTATQTVRVAFVGDTPTWIAVPITTVPWLQITGGTGGSGNGQFTVSVISSATLPATGTVAATIQVVSGGAVDSPKLVTVRLTLFAATTTTTAPFGAFETPVAGAAVQGSIAVTGWALDDIEVDRVEIWRDLVTGETTVPFNSPGHPGHGKVFIANTLFVAGARPDVETAYPTNPYAYRAGWGYLLLTWGLWNQGNGPFTLYAFAFDKEGKATTLGTKAITSSNATATKPFGGLDTPAYGQTVSASFWNYGWALTPNATPACTITNGNVSVAIDSGALTPVTYGGARTDIAAAFPGFSNGSNAGGAYYIDLAAVANGTHSIGWFVVDSCGRAEGVGSRFFTVAKSSLVAAPIRTAASPAQAVTGARLARAENGEPIGIRRLNGDWTSIYPAAHGTRVVPIAQDERIEVRLPEIGGASYVGYHVVNGELRALPLGSSLDAAQGIFYWQPAAGFLGSFDLAFVARDVATVRVRAVVGPSIRMAIDTPRRGAEVQQPLVVAGWAIDLASGDASGIDTVHVWAYPVTGGNPTFLGVAAYGDRRPDVAATYGAQFEQSAFTLYGNGLAPGTYDLIVYPHRVATDAFDGAQSVRVTVK